jgi:TolA-binding protein
VVHRPDARWSVEAGPFVIVVTGTVFDVRWSGSDDLLQVHLRTGAVTVQGPLLGGGITLQPGQELEARPGAGALRIGRAETPAVIEPASPPPAEAPTPRAVRPAAAQARPAPSRPDGGRAAPDLGAGWGRQIASGDFAGVVEEAEAHGVESCLRSLPADRLAALADAARYTGRLDLARRALMARRDRFAGTAEAQDATFLLGRLADDRKQNDSALLWYGTYLREAPAGTYAAEAEARAMLILQATSQPARARAAARGYLQRHPAGPYAGQARHILQGAP